MTPSTILELSSDAALTLAPGGPPIFVTATAVAGASLDAYDRGVILASSSFLNIVPAFDGTGYRYQISAPANAVAGQVDVRAYGLSATHGAEYAPSLTLTIEGPALAQLTTAVGKFYLRGLGSSVPLALSGRDARGRHVHVSAAKAIYSSSDPAVATVDAVGVVTARGDGTATVTAALGAATVSTAIDVRSKR